MSIWFTKPNNDYFIWHIRPNMSINLVLCLNMVKDIDTIALAKEDSRARSANWEAALGWCSRCCRERNWILSTRIL